jgi:plastocyanin
MTTMSPARPTCACFLAFLLLASCVSDRSATAPSGGAADCTMPLDALRQGAVPVLIRDFAFVPDTVRVRSGGIVVWVNCDATDVGPHTATAVSGAWGSPLLERGESFMMTFPSAGDHDYFCLPHSSMRGVVRVE